jgi:hypothetical protein
MRGGAVFISSIPDKAEPNHFDIFFIRLKSRSMLVLFQGQYIEVFSKRRAFWKNTTLKGWRFFQKPERLGLAIA